MKPIISPWTIYFASRADSLKILAGCILICCIIAICIAFIEGDIDYGSVLTHKSFMKKCAIVSVISKDVVDYITDQIDKVVNDKKENEK